jgi:hypothetical protein
MQIAIILVIFSQTIDLRLSVNTFLYLKNYLFTSTIVIGDV